MRRGYFRKGLASKSGSDGGWDGKPGVIGRFVRLEGLLWPFSMAMTCGNNRKKYTK